MREVVSSVALNAKVQVPLPERGVIVANQKGVRRVYHVLRTYRNDKGQPTNDRKLIGKIDEATGLLIPNNAYYDFYGEKRGETQPMEPAPVALDGERPVVSPVASILCSHILESLGAAEMLREAMGRERAGSVITAAAYMFSEGNVMERIGAWSADHLLDDGASLTSQTSSALFSTISRGDEMAFFRLWAPSLAQTEYLAYDTTSLSSYAKGLSDIEWGYNRDHERLPQLNLAAYVGRQSHLPAFYTTYPGSIVDKSHLPYMMALNDELGIDPSRVAFVMDRGFLSAKNLSFMTHEHMSYLIGVETRHKSPREAIESTRSDILSARNRLTQGVHGTSVHGRFYGQRATMHVFIDERLAAEQRVDLYRRVEVERETLAQLAEITGRDAKRLSRFHAIDRSPDGTFTFHEDPDAIDLAARYLGFFCILTNDRAMTSAEALSIYREHDVVEKGFFELKNHLDMRRLRTHTDETTAGKLFCAFVALIITQHVQTTLAKLMDKKSLSKKDIILELEKIRVVALDDGRRLLNPLTKLQREILIPFGLDEAFIRDAIESA